MGKHKHFWLSHQSRIFSGEKHSADIDNSTDSDFGWKYSAHNRWTVVNGRFITLYTYRIVNMQWNGRRSLWILPVSVVSRNWMEVGNITIFQSNIAKPPTFYSFLLWLNKGLMETKRSKKAEKGWKKAHLSSGIWKPTDPWNLLNNCVWFFLRNSPHIEQQTNKGKVGE